MMTLEEAIKHAEEVASDQECLMSRYDAASGYARSGNEAIRTESAKECEKCAAEHRQLAAWLHELQERRKEPEIIRCAECKHRFTHNCVANVWVSVFGYTVNDDFYCGLAERRPDADD